ncbi:MAG: aminotransferase class I/II-fold pyridoxal phosphate-dependent enzyme [Helicobacteraceae bacterium]
MFYDQELKAIKNAHRFRQRRVKTHLADFGSNDYLSLAHDRPTFNKTVSYLAALGTYGAKASQLVSGYHPTFRRFERYLCRLTGFPAAITIGSGFLANLALFEALPRKGDVLLVDADYHASGILGTKLTPARVEFFAHNSASDLRRHLQALCPCQDLRAASTAPAAQDPSARGTQTQAADPAQAPTAKAPHGAPQDPSGAKDPSAGFQNGGARFETARTASSGKDPYTSSPTQALKIHSVSTAQDLRARGSKPQVADPYSAQTQVSVQDPHGAPQDPSGAKDPADPSGGFQTPSARFETARSTTQAFKIHSARGFKPQVADPHSAQTQVGAQDPSTKTKAGTQTAQAPHTPRRIFIAVEGIYSMSGELLDRAIIDIAQEFGAILIVDEAHSVGVIGERLLGVLDHYGVKPNAHIIKLGTLGKALGSYGAYILASKEIVSFLENRAKPLIYSTAPSLFDIAYAYFALQKIQKNLARYKAFIAAAQDLAHKTLGIKTRSLILPVEFASSSALLKKAALLEKRGFFVAAIRPPTVKKPIIRLILRKDLKKLADLLSFL